MGLEGSRRRVWENIQNARYPDINSAYSVSLFHWQQGNLPSHVFLPLAYYKLLGTPHRFAGSTLDRIPPADILAEVKSSESLKTAYDLGLNGQNPRLITTYDIQKFTFIDEMQNISARNDLWGTGIISPLKSNLLSDIDPQLTSSLVGHSYLSGLNPKDYKNKCEADPYINYQNILKRYCPDQNSRQVIMLWLKTQSVLSHIRHLQVESLVKLNERKHNEEREFTMNSFLQRLVPLEFLNGWLDRLYKREGELKNSLRPPFNTHESQELILAAFFLKNCKKRYMIFGEVISALQTNNPEKAKNILRQLHRETIDLEGRSPLKMWYQEMLEVQPAPVESTDPFNVNGKSPSEEAAIICGLSRFFTDQIAARIGVDPRHGTIRLNVTTLLADPSIPASQLEFIWQQGILNHTADTVPANIMAYPQSSPETSPILLDKGQTYRVLASALLGLYNEPGCWILSRAIKY